MSTQKFTKKNKRVIMKRKENRQTRKLMICWPLELLILIADSSPSYLSWKSWIIVSKYFLHHYMPNLLEIILKYSELSPSIDLSKQHVIYDDFALACHQYRSLKSLFFKTDGYPVDKLVKNLSTTWTYYCDFKYKNKYIKLFIKRYYNLFLEISTKCAITGTTITYSHLPFSY